MPSTQTLSQKVEQKLYQAAGAISAFSYPLGWEKLEIDENRSLWASYTPNYVPGPPLKGNTTADLAIIGGGFTGVSTAHHFAARYPQKRVIILEAKSLANGASGRNGGMMLNWVYGTGPMSEETTRRVYQATSKTIDDIEKTIKTNNLEVSYRRDGCFEVFTDEERAVEAQKEVAYLNQLGIPIQFLDAAAVRQHIGLNNIYGGLFDPSEGQLNGVQFIRGLRPILIEQGVEIYEHSPVLKIREGSTITLTTPEGEVKAKAILLATNGYTGKLGYFRKAYFPLHSHVFATSPLSQEQSSKLGWRGTAGFADDLNRISYATQTKEGHLVFGGGSNISYGYLFNNRTAFPGSPDSAGPAFRDMQKTLNSYLPGSEKYPMTYRWTGTLAISLRRNCSIGVRGEYGNVYFALGYSGHGVTAANMAGRVLTDIYSKSDEKWRGLPFVNAPFSPIPLEPFRWMGYQMVTRLTGRSPREPFR
ncbi:MAG: FAD-dependent oxidoreductase [Ardenticatenaceae bacterium]|nr:FAD-dependent oxidoreductase [Ardenticatenaceae bacterium]